MEVETLRLAFFIVGNHQIGDGRAIRQAFRVSDLLTLCFALLFLSSFVQPCPFFLSLLEGCARASCHNSSVYVLLDSSCEAIESIFRAGPHLHVAPCMVAMQSGSDKPSSGTSGTEQTDSSYVWHRTVLKSGIETEESELAARGLGSLARGSEKLQPSELIPHYAVTLTRNILETCAILNGDMAAGVVDQPGLVEYAGR